MSLVPQGVSRDAERGRVARAAHPREAGRQHSCAEGGCRSACEGARDARGTRRGARASPRWGDSEGMDVRKRSATDAGLTAHSTRALMRAVQRVDRCRMPGCPAHRARVGPRPALGSIRAAGSGRPAHHARIDLRSRPGRSARRRGLDQKPVRQMQGGKARLTARRYNLVIRCESSLLALATPARGDGSREAARENRRAG
jgi:hypothetical protein